MNAFEIQMQLAAAALAAGCFWLGTKHAARVAGALDRTASAWPAGSRALAAAVIFTRSGYWPALVELSVVAALVAFALRASLSAVLWVVALQCVSQAIVALVKALFSRLRPDDWLFRAERGYSYPSGHATTAVVFYGGWLCALLASNALAPLYLAGAVALLGWALGICWSRVVLRAHYPSDVAGGVLAGGASLCAGLAIAHRWHLLNV